MRVSRCTREVVVNTELCEMTRMIDNDSNNQHKGFTAEPNNARTAIGNPTICKLKQDNHQVCQKRKV